MIYKLICHQCNKEYHHESDNFRSNRKFCDECRYLRNKRYESGYIRRGKVIVMPEVVDMKKVFGWDEVSFLI